MTVAIAVLAGAATVFFGIIPGPLLDLAADAGQRCCEPPRVVDHENR